MDAYQLEYDKVNSDMNDIFTLLEDCVKAYRLAKDSERRSFNQALFDRILVHEDKPIEAEYVEPLATLLDPSIFVLKNEFNNKVQKDKDGQPKTAAHFTFTDILTGSKTKTNLKNNIFFSAGLSKSITLQLTGLEPARSRTTRSLV